MALIVRHGLTAVLTTPSFFAALVAVGAPMPSLRIVHLGGEEVTDALVTGARRLLSRDCAIYNGYGPTEATISCAIHRVGPADHTGETRVPIGTASADNHLFVLNDALEPVADGEIGELVVGGDGVTPGYLGRPELTAASFVTPRCVGGERVYRTRDLVRRGPGGTLVLLGRADHQVKVRGYRVELGEIEAALADHPSIAALVVVVREPRPGVKVLVGYLVGHRRAIDGRRIVRG